MTESLMSVHDQNSLGILRSDILAGSHMVEIFNGRGEQLIRRWRGKRGAVMLLIIVKSRGFL